MKRTIVEVCVCADCVMHGAMDIIEAIEGLQKLKTQLRFNSQIQVTNITCTCGKKHKGIAPVICINGETLERANSQTVMSKVIAELRK